MLTLKCKSVMITGASVRIGSEDGRPVACTDAVGSSSYGRVLT